MSSTTHTTHHVYDKSRPGIYPKRSIQQQQTITFNETFRTLFPAVLAVLLSLIVLSAFNHMDSSMLSWIQQKGINDVKGHKITESLIPFDTKNKVMNRPNKPSTMTEYEGLSHLYWETKFGHQKLLDAKKYCKKELEVVMRNYKPDYEALGSRTSASYWANKDRIEKELNHCLASHV
ncbi:hypothetical protein PPL_11768 [Heterostelium album PN500]|uniref:Uncharacterized protein n=1 Tax=Heterostelium pallidum (strain ATCC 26659 / Pp 5 / PN500) TaxID=670386 RepID=D3BUE9_HETP5|nr:hypothetical protein PPL_11768 [Heterostelium album PN500]EFA74737.1 hypothetical protein PPL_11768 [Heterostelium album PN500]|eukprot:XP_020426871.1 hypothetical protein PPL_11768 [Heterostelium album PN500]